MFSKMKSFRGKNLLRHELIGLNAEVIASSHMGYEGIHGKIIDETKNMLKIYDGIVEKQVPKESVILSILLPDGTSKTIKGRDLVRRPIERVKRRGR
jgi:ribonuclease P protein subunit POP4